MTFFISSPSDPLRFCLNFVHLFQQMKLESPENVNLKTSAVVEILVFKIRLILQTSQKGVRKVKKWYF